MRFTLRGLIGPHKCDGQLFRGRFKSVLVEEDSYLLQLVRYIHRNPLKARMCKDLKSYPWSSHHGYLSISKKWDWLFKTFIFAVLSRGEIKGFTRYRPFMEMEDSKEITNFFSRKYLSPVLGSKKFLEWVRSKYYERRTSQEISNTSGLEPEVDLIKKVVRETYKVDAEYLLKVRRGFFNEPKFVAIYLTRMLTGMTLASIGKEYGIEKYSTVSGNVKRVATELATNKKFKNKVGKIEIKILKSQIKI